MNFILIGNINLTYMFLFGNFVVIMAMSYIQAAQQAMNHKKLILYNEKLLEADKLKDRIMATEMSFLQAQIKPHFLYNALSAIANVCEKDGKQASKLIIDLAIYLRGSLEFNNLDKMVTIEKELEFVDTYFHIEQARFGPKIQLKKEIGPEWLRVPRSHAPMRRQCSRLQTRAARLPSGPRRSVGLPLLFRRSCQPRACTLSDTPVETAHAGDEVSGRLLVAW